MRLPACLLAIAAACLIAACATAHTTAPASPAAQKIGGLQNVVRITDWLWSGAQPEGAEDFQSLADLGVMTIVSVDGAQPDVEGAKLAGLRYVHIPFGYDGIPEVARAQLKLATTECERPIYVHCHPGKHRGPAGAAIIYRCDTNCRAEDAAEIMRVAGTGEQYTGLWRDVREFEPIKAHSSGQPLREHATVPDFTTRMADIDRAWDRFTPGKESVSAASLLEDAVSIEENLKECLRFLDEKADPDLRTRLEAAILDATRLRENTDSAESRELENLQRQLGSDCQGCHKAHRN